MNYYIDNDLESMWKRVEKSSYVDKKETMISWLKIMEDGNLFKITKEEQHLIINSERLSDVEREEDEQLFNSEFKNNTFRVPVIIKDSYDNMILLYGGVHLEKMMEESDSCNVWIITKEWWRK